MRPDTFFAANTWVNLNSLLGIPVGTLIKVTNKTDLYTVLWEGASAPPSTPDPRHGEPVANGKSARSTDATTSLWVMSYSAGSTYPVQGRVSAQEWVQ